MAPGEPPRGRFLGPSSFTANAYLLQQPSGAPDPVFHRCQVGANRRSPTRAFLAAETTVRLLLIISSTVTGVPPIEVCLLASVKSIAQRHFARRSV